MKPCSRPTSRCGCAPHRTETRRWRLAAVLFILPPNRPILETERLVLRPVSADELRSLHRISNEPEVRLYLWDDEQVSEATIEGLVAQSDLMFSEEDRK